MRCICPTITTHRCSLMECSYQLSLLRLGLSLYQWIKYAAELSSGTWLRLFCGHNSYRNAVPWSLKLSYAAKVETSSVFSLCPMHYRVSLLSCSEVKLWSSGRDSPVSGKGPQTVTTRSSWAPNLHFKHWAIQLKLKTQFVSQVRVAFFHGRHLSAATRPCMDTEYEYSSDRTKVSMDKTDKRVNRTINQRLSSPIKQHELAAGARILKFLFSTNPYITAT